MNCLLIHLKKNNTNYQKYILDSWNNFNKEDNEMIFKLVYYYSDTTIAKEYILKQVDDKIFLSINVDEVDDIQLYFKAMFILNRLHPLDLVVKCKENVLIDSYLLSKFIKKNVAPFVSSTEKLENSPLFVMTKVMIHGFSRWIELNLDKKIDEYTFSYILQKGDITPKYENFFTKDISEFVEKNNIISFFDEKYQTNMNAIYKLLPDSREMSIKYFDNRKSQLIIDPKGGFGNLLFQCLFGYYHAMKLGVNLVFNKEYRDVRQNVSSYKLLKHLNFCNIEYIDSIDNMVDYKEPNFFYTKVHFDDKTNYRVNGYFQSHKYFDQKSFDLFKLHMFKEQMDLVIEAKLYIDDIKLKHNKPVVLVHIRRGDYVNNNKYITLPEDYYRNAINSIQNDCVYLIFSDDIEYVKTLNLFNNLTHVICDEQDVEKTFLRMTFCDHFIIANSTLSLSSYYFRNNEKAILMAPHKWFGETFKHQYRPSDLLPQNTVLIQF